MTIQFTRYPVNTNRVPGTFIEVDPSKANSGQVNLRTLIIGQVGPGATLAPGVPVICQGVAWTQTNAGLGSMLALQVATYRLGDTFGEVWLLPLADDPNAVKATGTVTFGGIVTATGVLSLYIAGQLLSVLLAAGTTGAQAAAAVVAAVAAGAAPNLPVVLSATGAVVTATARNAGLAGNDVDLRVNYQGFAGGEVLPAGLTVAFAPMSGGLLNPSLTTPLANLADEPFEFVQCPYTDTTSLNSIGSFLDDNTGRWAWSRMIYGHAFAALRGTIGSLTTFGVARNDQHVSVMGFWDSPTPAWLWSAALAATCATSLRADPALPLNPDSTTILQGVLAPPIQSRFVLSDRNTLLFDGVATFAVDTQGNVTTERVVTTYQKTAAGAPDSSYLDVETMETLAFVLRDLRIYIQSQFARKKLVSDATRVTGNNIISPAIVKASIIARYRILEALGYVQNSDVFAVGLQVEAAGGGLVKILWPGDLVGQARQFAILASFVKST